MGFKFPGDEFLKDVATYADPGEQGPNGPVKPQDVGFRNQGVVSPNRMSGAKLGGVGLVTAVAEEGIKQHVVPFLVDRAVDTVKGLNRLAKDPSMLSRNTGGINPFGFGGGF
mgnify:FL=1